MPQNVVFVAAHVPSMTSTEAAILCSYLTLTEVTTHNIQYNMIPQGFGFTYMRTQHLVST